MALKLALSKCYPIREYSAITNPLISMPSLSYETTTLPNKMIVASADTNSPIVRVSIAYKSGSRDESSDNLGCSHAVRVASGLSTKRSTSFGIIRNLQQYGLKMYTEHDRETFMYTLESHRDNIEKGVDIFEDVACNAAFKPWEIPELLPRLRQELNERTHVTKVMDNLHKAAFRYGLGNSIYAPKYFLNNLDSENLMHYFYSNFVPSRAVVLGHGIPHDELLKFAQNLPICQNSKCSNYERIASKFHSGEIRFDKGGSLATFAIATQGASIKNRKEYLALCILRQIFGVGSKVKWASESGSILAKHIDQRPEINVSAFNLAYSDNGLFGILASCPAEKADKVAQGIYKTLKTGKVSEKDVRRGKNQAIASFLLTNESLKTHLANSAQQLLNVGQYQSNDSLVSDIEKLTDSDINNVAKKITTSKLAMSSYGHIHNVPFLDELK